MVPTNSIKLGDVLYMVDEGEFPRLCIVVSVDRLEFEVYCPDDTQTFKIGYGYTQIFKTKAEAVQYCKDELDKI